MNTKTLSSTQTAPTTSPKPTPPAAPPKPAEPAESTPQQPQDQVDLSQDPEDPEPATAVNPLVAGLETNFGAGEQGGSPEEVAAVGGAAEGGEAEPGGSAGSAGGLGGIAEALGSKEPLTPEEQARREENEALTTLDENFDIYDDRGGDDTDGIVSTDDLESVANGDFDEERVREQLAEDGLSEEEIDAHLQELQDTADYLLENEELLDELDVANDESDTDGKISRGDLASELQERHDELVDQGLVQPGDPSVNRDTYPEVETVNEREDQELIAQQEAQIAESLANGGDTVSFTNSNGETEELSVRQVESTGGDVVYELEGEDGNIIRVESGLSAEDSTVGLARVADYYTQLPDHLRQGVEEIEFHAEPDDTAAADYSDGRIRFFDGLEHINEEVFNHEVGHAVGDGLDEDSEARLTPEGWEPATESDPDAVSDYSDEGLEEDFADSFAAYLEARENGPEALAEFAELYPERYAILEDVYANAA